MRTGDQESADTPTRFRSISDALPLGIFVSDGQGRCVYANAAYLRISGLTCEQVTGTTWCALIHPTDRPAVLEQWHDAVRSHKPFRSELRFLRSDGSHAWVRIHGADFADEVQSGGQVLTFEDITTHQSAAILLRTAQATGSPDAEWARITLHSMGDAVLTTDSMGRVIYLNPVAVAMTGWSRNEAAGRPLVEVFRIIDGVSRQPLANPVQRAITEDQTGVLAADCVLIRRDGCEVAIEDSVAPIHARDGRVVGAAIVFRSIGKSRAMAQRMSHQARHDFLTGLPNRVLLAERLAQAHGLAQRHGKQVALLFIDLDLFKHVNDSLGHAIGDRLLQSVAGRLTTCVRITDTVCRYGGDEFVILLAEIEQSRDAARVAEKLYAAFAEPFFAGEHVLHVTLSIGISVCPDEGTDVETVMQHADTAMYHAKAGGRNHYQFFRPEMNHRAVRRLRVESCLHRALEEQEFVLYYQPEVDLVSGLITGVEALVRWRNTNGGFVYPGQFVPVAEECGLIVPIGRWVLRAACVQARQWLDDGLRAITVAVNISAAEFRHRDFLDGLATILQETGMAADHLELELTEGILMHDVGSSVAVLRALKTMGIRLVIDDFGTGYSSLGYLKRFPIDKLKIDPSFVQGISVDTDNATLVRAVIGMGHNLGKRVVAEGVETAVQLDFLRQQCCDAGQGFLFSHPLPAGDFLRLFDTENALRRN